MSFPQWQPGQASPEVPVNEAFDILKFLAVFGRDPETTTGLTWGYLGGPWNGLTITAGTVLLTASSTNYIVANRSTGVVSVSTTTTNWDDSTTYARIYSIVAGSLSITSFTDFRGSPNGVLGPRAVVVSGLPAAVNGDLLRFNSTSGQWEAADLVQVLPTATDGEFIVFNSVANEWQALNINQVLPAGSEGDLLRYNATTSEWEPVALEQVLPAAVTDDTLVFNGTVWVAQAPSGGGGSSTQAIPVALSDETSVISTANSVKFRMPYAMTLTKVKASLNYQSEGDDLVVDVLKNGVSIFSTSLRIDESERTSETSITPAVISTPNLADDDEITINVIQVGTSYGGEGLKVYLVGTV